MVREIQSKDEFDQLMKEAGGKLIVVDFHATWCGPCKMIAPKIQAMSVENPDVIFVKVDVDDVEDLAAAYNVSCMPTFLFVKNGEQVDQFAGANEEKIRDLVAKHK